MTKFMHMVAIAALTTVSAAPVVAQQTADPFVSTQTGALVNLTGLSNAFITAVSLGLVAGVALVLDDEGNVIGTTTTSR